MPTSPNLYSLCSLFIILSAKDLNKVTDEAEWHSGRVAVLQHQRPGFNPDWMLSVHSLDVLPVSTWVFSACSGFLSHFKDIGVCKIIGYCKVSIVPSV